MLIRRVFMALAICAVALSIACAASAREGTHTTSARIRFLATSWVIRGTSGPNQDTYLAEMLPINTDPPFLIYLIDDYANEFPSISRETLVSQAGSVMRVRRDAQCDMLFRQINLRTAPGDPMAILPGRLGYQPQLDRQPNPDENIPCYRIARKR
jgi:hypothetical protein